MRHAAGLYGGRLCSYWAQDTETVQLLGTGYGDWAVMNWEVINWAVMNWEVINWEVINWEVINWAVMNWEVINWEVINWEVINWEVRNWAVMNWEAINWEVMNWAVMNWEVINWVVMNWAVINWEAINWEAINWEVMNWEAINWEAINWEVMNWAVINWAVINWEAINFEVSETSECQKVRVAGHLAREWLVAAVCLHSLLLPSAFHKFVSLTKCFTTQPIPAAQHNIPVSRHCEDDRQPVPTLFCPVQYSPHIVETSDTAAVIAGCLCVT
jgi:hypothetical protein